ncbi:MAG: response regulator [Puniceicoccales bacterium]|jgi:DNA-binding response OmpR family regulator|nr:response regulator [Puniceicoccales bacterium]
MKRIFLIEDDVSLCSLLAKMLKFEGISTIIANDGPVAKKILEQFNGKINVILCDIMMPGMDGYEFFECVKQTKKFADVPFVFVSARVSKEEEVKGLSMGARAFLKKPVDIATILSVIHQFDKN